MSWLLLTNAGAETSAGLPGLPGASAVAPLHVEGLHLCRPDHTIVKGLGITQFRSLELFLRGWMTQLDAWSALKREHGYLGGRTFSYHKPPNVRPFDPREFPHYYEDLPKYFQYELDRGQYVDFVLFLGAVPPDDPFLTYDAQLVHAEQCLAIARRFPNVHIEVANEGEDNDMAATVNRFPAWMFDGVLSCRTRMIALDDPTTGQCANQLDWLNHHPERKGGFDTTRKFRDGEIFISACHKPLKFMEPEQCGRDGYRGVHPNEGIYVNQVRMGTYCALLFGEWVVTHGAWENLQQCLVPTGEVLDCVREAGEAFRAHLIPPEVTDWGYHADEDAPVRYALRFARTEQQAREHGWTGSPADWGDYTVDQTGCKHAYARVSPDGRRAAVVNLEVGNQFILEAKPGWHLVTADPYGVAAYLERS